MRKLLFQAYPHNFILNFSVTMCLTLKLDYTLNELIVPLHRGGLYTFPHVSAWLLITPDLGFVITS